MLDIFNNDAFSIVSLTDAVNRMPFVPGQAGRTGIFVENGVATVTVVIEQRDGLLNLIPNTQRGEPPLQGTPGERRVVPLLIPHHVIEDKIKADEIQGVRSFGSDDMLATMQEIVDQRLQDKLASHDATVEYGRIGAIKGVIYDADGTTVLIDLFTAFGVTQVVVDFKLDVATTDLKSECLQVLAAMEAGLGATGWTGVNAFCGESFWEKLITHDNAKEAYDRWQDGAFLRQDPREGFPLNGIFFERYRGIVGNPDGNPIKYVADTDAHFYPLGVPQLFRTYFGPADFVETANTIGLPRYAKQAVDPRFQQFVELHTQSNALSICRRPEALIKGTE